MAPSAKGINYPFVLVVSQRPKKLQPTQPLLEVVRESSDRSSQILFRNRTTSTSLTG